MLINEDCVNKASEIIFLHNRSAVSCRIHYVACAEADTNSDVQVWAAIHGNPPSREGFTIFPVLLHPRSKGNVRLKSKNPDDLPLINPNYLSEEVDVKILAEGIAVVFCVWTQVGNLESCCHCLMIMYIRPILCYYIEKTVYSLSNVV